MAQSGRDLLQRRLDAAAIVLSVLTGGGAGYFSSAEGAPWPIVIVVASAVCAGTAGALMLAHRAAVKWFPALASPRAEPPLFAAPSAPPGDHTTLPIAQAPTPLMVGDGVSRAKSVAASEPARVAPVSATPPDADRARQDLSVLITRGEDFIRDELNWLALLSGHPRITAQSPWIDWRNRAAEYLYLAELQGRDLFLECSPLTIAALDLTVTHMRCHVDRLKDIHDALPRATVTPTLLEIVFDRGRHAIEERGRTRRYAIGIRNPTHREVKDVVVLLSDADALDVPGTWRAPYTNTRLLPRDGRPAWSYAIRALETLDFIIVDDPQNPGLLGPYWFRFSDMSSPVDTGEFRFWRWADGTYRLRISARRLDGASLAERSFLLRVEDRAIEFSPAP